MKHQAVVVADDDVRGMRIRVEQDALGGLIIERPDHPLGEPRQIDPAIGDGLERDLILVVDRLEDLLEKKRRRRTR